MSGDIIVANDFDRNLPDINTTDLSTCGPRQLTAIRYLKFLERVSHAFPYVVYVAGNHEFYHGKWVKSLEILRNICSKFPNIHFLEQESVKINDVTFIGGTLWTDMNKGDPITMHSVSSMMNDYRVIKNDAVGYVSLRPAHTVDRHRNMVKFIKQQIEAAPNEKFVVVGHHTPTKLSIHERYTADYTMNGAYSSDLSDLILDHPQIKLWTCGHVHHAHWYYMGDTLVVCNPRGYTTEAHLSEFNPSLVIDLDAMPDAELVSNNYNHSTIARA